MKYQVKLTSTEIAALRVSLGVMTEQWQHHLATLKDAEDARYWQDNITQFNALSCKLHDALRQPMVEG